MAHINTILSQLLKLVPRHEFEALPNQHYFGQSFRTTSRWSQFVVMLMGQLAGRVSLRDIVNIISVQSHHLYHLDTSNISRSNLSRINSDKPYQLYEALFSKPLKRFKSVVLGHNFCFKNSLHSLDASTIDLCLSAFFWADFRYTKGAIKLHVGLNHSGFLPEFVTITKGKTPAITVGRTLNFPKGSIVAIDRAITTNIGINS